MLIKRPISQCKSHSAFISLVISVLLLAGCGRLPGFNSPTTIPPKPTLLPPVIATTPILPSPTALVPLATQAPIPASPTPMDTLSSIPPSPTLQPIATTAPVLASGTFAFAPGTTAGVVQGTVQPGQVVTYTLGAGQSQPLILIMNSPNNDVTLGVFEPNGNMLVDPANKWTRWQGLLPATELYTIQVIGGATTENYTLTAKIPQRVNFAVGASSITLNGTTVNGNLFAYVFSCQASQTMTGSLNVPSSTATIDIFGLATGSLLSAATKATSWTGVLPQTQDYVIEVVPTNGQVVNYSLTVSVTSAAATPVAMPAGNILFAPGTTAGVVQGTVQPGQVVTYTLGAEQSQDILLSVDSPNHDVTLGVIEPDGSVLVNPANKWSRLQWPLPESGLYTIQVIGGATTENYTLTAKIPQRVNFALGTSSITLSGTTVNGFVFSYALNCQGNQTMTVSLNAPSSAATLDIFGIATGTLLNASAKATSGTVVLPQTQDYVIEVIPTNGQVVNYALTVTVTSPLSATATNIVFALGTTAGEVKGTIQPGQVLTYTISVGQDVPMVVILDSLHFDVTLGVFEPNGNVLAAPYHKWTRWQGLLPATELYTIQVIAGATTEDFTLTVKLPVRINFAPGTGSVTVNGTTTNGYVFSYVLRCNGNQSMTASLNVPSTKAYLDVFGLNTGVLLSPSKKATSWTGVLPQYQDYVIEVIPRNGQLTSYTLTVSVH